MIQYLKKKPKRSLRWILALWFLSFAIVPIIFLTIYSLRKFQQTIDNELVLRLKGNASEIQVILNEYQKALQRQHLQNLKSPQLIQYILSGKTQGLSALLEGWLTESTASAILFYNREGILAAKAEKTPSTSSAPHSERQKRVSLHPTLLRELENKKIHLIPDHSVPRMLNLLMLSPIFQGKSLLGFFQTTLSLDEGFLKRLSERMQLQGLLLEPNGRIIAGSHPDFLLYKPDFFSDFLKIPKLKVFSLPLRGDPFGFIFTKMSWGESQFLVALAASRKESNAAVENLRVAYYSLLAIMMVVLALSVLGASRVVLRPLSELIEAIQDLHLGENIIELPIKSDNEIGQLTTSFNELSRRILSAQRDLKDKIKELEQSNSHLKETQGQLVQSAKMASLGQLVAGVAHELNNPIGFIYSNMTHLREYSNQLLELIDCTEKNPSVLAQLKKEYDLDYIRKDLPKLIASCEEGARRTKEIVIGLRNFSRIEEKTHQPTDLHLALDNTLNLLNSEYKNRIEVKKTYGELPKVTCNPTQINQVFMNILSNAAQAIEGKGTVWITTQSHPDPNTEEKQEVSISIQDSGVGVPEESLQKIFDPFYTTKAVGQGTGLGLAISYGIINAHGGTIQVTSKLGAGTEFVITLPTNNSRPSRSESSLEEPQ